MRYRSKVEAFKLGQLSLQPCFGAILDKKAKIDHGNNPGEFVLIARGGRFFLVLFWLAATFAFVMATLPRPPQLPGEPSDKVQHIIAFAVLTGLAFAAYSWNRWLPIIVGLCAFGGVIELVQLIPVLHRDGSWLDWLADTATVLVVAGCVNFAHRLWCR